VKTTLKQLQIFTSIARNRNLSKAAKENFLSQSAASMSLAELERQLGKKLFDRIGRQLELNALGKSLLPKALDIIERAKEIEEICQQESSAVTGSLKVGASSTIGNYLIPKIVGDFVKQHPTAHLLLDIGNTEHVTRELLDFNIDIGFIEGFCEHPLITVSPWFPDRLIVFSAPDHPLAQKKPSRSEILHSNWILRERGSGTRDIFERALDNDVHKLNIFLELGHTEAIKQAVEANLGISCLSVHVLKRALREGSLVEIPTPFWDLRRMFTLLVHKNKYQTRIFEEFAGFACQSILKLPIHISHQSTTKQTGP